MSLGGLQSLLSLASLGEKNRAATSLAQEALQRLSAEDVEIARQVREYMERQRGTSGGGSGSSSSLMAQGGGAAAPEVLLLEQRVRRRGSFDLTSPSPSDAVLPARPSSSHHTREPTLSHAFPTLSSPVGSPTGRAAPGSSPQRSPSQAVLGANSPTPASASNRAVTPPSATASAPASMGEDPLLLTLSLSEGIPRSFTPARSDSPFCFSPSVESLHKGMGGEGGNQPSFTWMVKRVASQKAAEEGEVRGSGQLRGREEGGASSSLFLPGDRGRGMEEGLTSRLSRQVGRESEQLQQSQWGSAEKGEREGRSDSAAREVREAGDGRATCKSIVLPAGQEGEALTGASSTGAGTSERRRTRRLKSRSPRVRGTKKKGEDSRGGREEEEDEEEGQRQQDQAKPSDDGLGGADAALISDCRDGGAEREAERGGEREGEREGDEARQAQAGESRSVPDADVAGREGGRHSESGGEGRGDGSDVLVIDTTTREGAGGVGAPGHKDESGGLSEGLGSEDGSGAAGHPEGR